MTEIYIVAFHEQYDPPTMLRAFGSSVEAQAWIDQIKASWPKREYAKVHPLLPSTDVTWFRPEQLDWEALPFGAPIP